MSILQHVEPPGIACQLKQKLHPAVTALRRATLTPLDLLGIGKSRQYSVSFASSMPLEMNFTRKHPVPVANGRNPATSR